MFRYIARIALTSAFIVATIGALPAQADSNYRCDSAGASPAIVNGCGARWRAANIRAHVSAGNTGDANAACLMKTADLLEQMATTWVASGKYTPFDGTWPCGSLPAIGGTDDGVLAKACPSAVWSYDNAGISGCTIPVAPNPVASDLPMTPASDNAGPSFEETMQWLGDNLPVLSNYTQYGNPLRFHWQTRIAGTGCSATLSLQYTTDGDDWHFESETDLQLDLGTIKSDELTVTANGGRAPQISVTTRSPLSWSKTESGGAVDNPKPPASSSGSTSSWNVIVSDAASGARIINALRRASSLCANATKPQPF